MAKVKAHYKNENRNLIPFYIGNNIVFMQKAKEIWRNWFFYYMLTFFKCCFIFYTVRNVPFSLKYNFNKQNETQCEEKP